MSGSVSITRTSEGQLGLRQMELAEFERGFRYPLGAGMFRIDHGEEYLAFFRGLGKPTTWLAEKEGRIVGILVAVWRLMPEPTWYLCDLKVAPGMPGLGRKLLEAFEQDWGRVDPAYGMSMDPVVGANRLVRATRRCRRVQVQRGPQMHFWMLDPTAWFALEPQFVEVLGPVGFLEAKGRKDIVLVDGAEDTSAAEAGRRLPLLHVQHGRFARPNVAAPGDGQVLMFCLPAQHRLTDRLRRQGFHPGATASVLHHGMAAFDWESILTSDI